MMKPIVSVIIPCYRSGRYVEEAVRSVQAQTFQDWEFLLVNDGSGDAATLEALERIEAFGDDRIQLLQHPGAENRGVSASRNLGLDHARGRYIAFLDSDDAWLPEKLKRQVAILEAAPKEVGLVFSSYYNVASHAVMSSLNESDWQLSKDADALPKLFDGNARSALSSLLWKPATRYVNWIQSPTPLVRAVCFESGLRFVGPPQLNYQFEDYLMWLELACHYEFIGLSEPLALYRTHSGQYTAIGEREDEVMLHLNAMHQVFALFLARQRSNLSVTEKQEIARKLKRSTLLRVEHASGRLLSRLIAFSAKKGYLVGLFLAMVRRYWNRLHYAVRRSKIFKRCQPMLKTLFRRKASGTS